MTTWDFTTPPLTGIKSLNVQTFSASGTYTPTPGMKFAILEVKGSGAAGGGVTGTALNSLGGGGGGSGGYTKVLVTAAQVGASQPVTIGLGGVGINAATGGAGNDSGVGTLAIAHGGVGGQLNNNSTGFGSPGAGAPAGSSSAGIVMALAPGSPGGQGTLVTMTGGFGVSVDAIGGYGGGDGGAPQTISGGPANPGLNASDIGGGGSGASVFANVGSQKGGDGFRGGVTITEFIG